MHTGEVVFYRYQIPNHEVKKVTALADSITLTFEHIDERNELEPIY